MCSTQRSTNVCQLIQAAGQARDDFRKGRICKADLEYTLSREDVALSEYTRACETEDVADEQAADDAFKTELLMRLTQAVETIANPDRYEISGLVADMATAAFRVYGNCSLRDLRREVDA